MEKIWLQQYPKGVPSEIPSLQHQSINEFFRENCEKYADKPALIYLDHTWTYDELYQGALHLASYFQQKLHLKKGNTLGLMLPNTPQYYFAFFGAFLAGLIVVPINPLYTARELIHQANDSEIHTLIVLANFAYTVEEALPQISIQQLIVTELGDLLPKPKKYVVNFFVKYIKKLVPSYHLPQAISFTKIMGLSVTLLTPVTLSPQDTALLQYTGGTTGVSKGAVLSHANLLSNTEQAYLWIKHFLKEGEETIVAALPLYHIFALTVGCFIFLKIGGRALLITNPKDISDFIQQLKKNKFTVMIGVNTLFKRLLEHPDFKKTDFSNLKLTITGGMSLQHSVFERWKVLTTQPIVEGYGLTETSPIVSINPPENSEYKGSIGLPVPGTDICIVNESNEKVGINEIGELCVKGPQVMKEYWKNTEETQHIFLETEWLRTGDIVRMDAEGYLYIVDRKKDMILVSGFCVYPHEIEDIILEDLRVSEVAVIGVKDSRTGEAVKAYIVKKDINLTEEDLRSHCAKYLTAYKQPKFITFIDALPKNMVGKVLKRELRALNTLT